MANNNIEYVGLNTITRVLNNVEATYALKTVFGAASDSAAGSAGLVPAPTAGDQLKFLRADGTWAIPDGANLTLSKFGITATAEELNILDGATISVTELNHLDGVTSSIQNQLNDKANSTHKHNASDITGGKLEVTEIELSDLTVSDAIHTISLTESGIYISSNHPDVQDMYIADSYNIRIDSVVNADISGNAGSATKLKTSRKLTIGSTGKDFDGSAPLTWSLAEIGAATADHTHSTYLEAGGLAIAVDDSAVIAAVTAAASA